MEEPEKGEPPKVILTVAQMKALLAAEMPVYMRSWIVLGGFAGIRTEELLRMTWNAVNLEEKEIHVSREAIKRTRGGMRERYVSMLPAVIRHSPQGQSGKIIPVARTTFHYHAKRIAKAVFNIEDGWPHNCLRHSFASYHLAMWEDSGKTAHQMGHTSPNMVHQNYARAVKKKEATEWWAL
ncbi:phage integrase family protein [Terrimicrobium sacchariphilum]|uniref:Phage integrase family protein n=2 Tax=Terrimicrobium sacchariphilum TaxID=690879 RepID=A0A146G680_TERSA|nr:phage integrase family protein [Terrimicrobium sacchariphilum]